MQALLTWSASNYWTPRRVSRTGTRVFFQPQDIHRFHQILKVGHEEARPTDLKGARAEAAFPASIYKLICL